MEEIYNKDGEIDFSAIFKALFRRKKIIYLTAGLALSTSFIFTTYQRISNPIYKGSFRFLVNDPLKNSSKSIPGISTLSIFDSLTKNDSQQDIPTLIELFKSPTFLAPFAKKYDLDPISLSDDLDLKLVYGKTGRSNNSKGSIEVKYFSNNRKNGLVILTNLKDYFLKMALDEKRKQLDAGLIFLESQTPILEKKGDQLQKELSDFRIKNNLLEPQLEGIRLRNRLNEVELNLIRLKAFQENYEDIKRKLKDGKLRISDFTVALRGIIDSTKGGLLVYQSETPLLEKVTKLEKELADARTTYLPSSKVVKDLENKLKVLKPEINKAQLEVINIAISDIKSRMEFMNQQYTLLNKRFLKQANLVESFALLSEKLKFARLSEQTLSATIDKFKLEIAQNRLPWRILQEPSFGSKPIKPSFSRNLLIALFSGTFIGVLLSLIRDTLDNVFHSSNELRDFTTLPLLGEIPYTNTFDNLRTRKDLSDWLVSLDTKDLGNSSDDKKYQRFFYQESFRNLFTSIKFMGSESPICSIVLTSTQSSEGKSLIATMLCKTLSEVGQKILLIDCDLRKPQLHKRLNLNNINGLSNILTQKDGIDNWSKYVQSVPNHSTWKLITSGTVPPDPTRLLSSQKMKQFVNQLNATKEFDLIIFDTPPVAGLADSALVGNLCDGLIYVVSLENVDKKVFNESLNRLDNLRSKVLGLISNEISKPSKSKFALNENANGYKNVYSSYFSKDEEELDEKAKYQNVGIFKKIFKNLLSWIDN